jgi:hypothetical protein
MARMRRLAELLPPPPRASSGSSSSDGPRSYELPAVHLLGADLPPGHVHLWVGPPAAGKTAFLLGLLLDAARHGRTTVLATYDLPAQTLALRLHAMASGVGVEDLLAMRAGEAVPAAALDAAARAHASLAALPLFLLEARGMGLASIEDRLVRLPRRADVLGIDLLSGVVRPADPDGSSRGSVLRGLSALAVRLHVAIVAADGARAVPSAPTEADRVGWIAPAERPGTCEATILANRHGRKPSCRLRLDPRAARWVADGD